MIWGEFKCQVVVMKARRRDQEAGSKTASGARPGNGFKSQEVAGEGRMADSWEYSRFVRVDKVQISCQRRRCIRRSEDEGAERGERSRCSLVAELKQLFRLDSAHEIMETNTPMCTNKTRS
jgi:hypothetical protein